MNVFWWIVAKTEAARATLLLGGVAGKPERPRHETDIRRSQQACE